MSKILLGIDEAGRGSLIGPLVIAGVILKKESLDVLKEIGVRDSKKLSRKKREELYKELIKVCDGIKIKCIPPQIIDKQNLNELEIKCFSEMINYFRPEKVYIDAPVNKNGIDKFTDSLRKFLMDKDTELIIKNKADSFYSIVSAASIIAKVKRDLVIKRLRERYGDFGWGYPGEKKVKEFLYRAIKEKKSLTIIRKKWSTFKKSLFFQGLIKYNKSEL